MVQSIIVPEIITVRYFPPANKGDGAATQGRSAPSKGTVQPPTIGLYHLSVPATQGFASRGKGERVDELLFHSSLPYID